MLVSTTAITSRPPAAPPKTAARPDIAHRAAASRPAGLCALAWAIRLYRRRVSGRGPLRRVTCSFHAAESCSAYGLRVSEEVATGLGQALGLIRRRLRSCGDVAIVRFPDGPDHPHGALAWGALHDRPISEVATELADAGERPDSCALVVSSRALVAAWRGDAVDAARCRVALTRLAVAPPRVVVRPGPATVRWLRHRVATRAGAGVALAVLLVLTVPALAAAAALALIAILTVVTTGPALRRLRRTSRHLRVAGLGRPGWPATGPRRPVHL